MEREDTVEDVLDTIGDEHAREILAAISAESRSAKELAQECNLSLPTVYRRLETLEAHDLITHRTLVGDDGNHYKVYDCNFDSTVISLEDEGEYTVKIYRGDTLPEQFSQLWEELSVE